jgi:protein-S-isoprenylcysteine O-methyltransferase Ste14
MKPIPSEPARPRLAAEQIPSGDVKAPPAGTRSHWLLVPPPPIFMFPLGIGIRMGRVLPLPLVPAGLHHAAHLAGIAIIVLGAALMVSAPLLFLFQRTTIIPHGDARSMVVRGPYRISRNPMYLGLTVAYLGVTLLVGTAWPLLFLAFPLWVVQTKTIPFEEQTLTRIFGDEYRAYQRRVRRWI